MLSVASIPTRFSEPSFMSYYNIGDKAHALARYHAVVLGAMIFPFPQLVAYGIGFCLAHPGKGDVARVIYS